MEDLVLISIKTKYANQIFAGTKIFEYRRKSIGVKNCNRKIFVYSSEEERAIVGFIIVDKILEGIAEEILEKTDNNPIILNYFEVCEKCYALHIAEAHKFAEPILLKDIKEKYDKFTVPQFYRYVRPTEEIYNELKNQEQCGVLGIRIEPIGDAFVDNIT